MTLNPIPGVGLHNMIVEGLSMPAALKENLKPIVAPKGLAGDPVAISESVASCDHPRWVLFWIEKFPTSLKLSTCSRGSSVPVRFRSNEVPSGCKLMAIGSYVLELNNLGNSGTGKTFVPSIYQFTYNDEEREMLKLGLVKPNSYADPL